MEGTTLVEHDTKANAPTDSIQGFSGGYKDDMSEDVDSNTREKEESSDSTSDSSSDEEEEESSSSSESSSSEDDVKKSKKRKRSKVSKDKRKHDKDDASSDESDSDSSKKKKKKKKNKKNSKKDENVTYIPANFENGASAKPKIDPDSVRKELIKKNNIKSRQVETLILQNIKISGDFFGVKGRKYDCILADPPWYYGESTTVGAAAEKYMTIKTNVLMKFPIHQIASDACCVLMWTTGKMMGDAIRIIEAWGFTYKTVFINWIKTFKNGNVVLSPGGYTRPGSEFMLVGTRGTFYKEWKGTPAVSQVLVTERREHSRKPDEAISKIANYFGPKYEKMRKIELFARNPMPGWDCWGNEITKFSDIKLVKKEKEITEDVDTHSNDEKSEKKSKKKSKKSHKDK